MEIFYRQCLNCNVNVEFDKPQDFICPSCGWVNSDKNPDFRPLMEDYNEDFSKIVYVPIDPNKLINLDIGIYNLILKFLENDDLKNIKEIEQLKSIFNLNELTSYKLIIALLNKYMSGKDQYFEPKMLDIYDNITWLELKEYLNNKKIPERFEDQEKFKRSIEIIKDKYKSHYQPWSKFINQIMDIFSQIYEPPEELKPYTKVFGNIIAKMMTEPFDVVDINKKLKPINDLVKFLERISKKVKDADSEYLINNSNEIRKLVRIYKKEFSSVFGNALRK